MRTKRIVSRVVIKILRFGNDDCYEVDETAIEGIDLVSKGAGRPAIR
jgi:hypothetical protein